MTTKTTYRARCSTFLSSHRTITMMPNGLKGHCSATVAKPFSATLMAKTNGHKVTFQQSQSRSQSSQGTQETPPSSHDQDNTKKEGDRSIPLPSTHIARTKSELQLREDTAAAEWADRCMFHRVVSGIRERQRHLLESEMITATTGPCIQKERQVEQRYSSTEYRFRQTSAVHVGTGINATKPAHVSSSRRSSDYENKNIDNVDNPTSSRIDLHSALHRVACEDWSLEGYDETQQSKDQPQDHQDDNTMSDDCEGIFSLDL